MAAGICILAPHRAKAYTVRGAPMFFLDVTARDLNQGRGTGRSHISGQSPKNENGEPLPAPRLGYSS